MTRINKVSLLQRRVKKLLNNSGFEESSKNDNNN
jgi:hypothetical protein